MSRRDLSPREAARHWMDKRSVEFTEQTQQTYWYRIKQLAEYLEDEAGIDSMADLDPWTLDEFDAAYRRRGVEKVTLKKNYGTINNWLDWAETVGIAPEGISEVLDPPAVAKQDEVSRERLVPEVATANLDAFRSRSISDGRASLKHTLLELMWWSGARIGALRGLDRGDVNLEAGTVEFVHRPETGTPIKQAFNPERVIGFPDDVVAVLRDYAEHVRPQKVFDEYAREPFLTTSQGRLSEQSALRYSKFATVPCHGGPCPHGQNQPTCEWFNLRQARSCPSSRGPHAVRTGAITNLRNSGWALDEVAERVNTSPERIKQHYDFPDKDEQYRERRADLVDRLGLTDDETQPDNDSM